MFGSYLKLALRHLRRRPEFAAVNVGGLAVGLAGCILALFFVRDELSFDRFHDRVDRIYEVKSRLRVENDEVFLETQGPVGPALAAEFPEVEAATRLPGRVIIRPEEDLPPNSQADPPSSIFSVSLTGIQVALRIPIPSS
jgi:putative ABC transport system permease protein